MRLSLLTAAEALTLLASACEVPPEQGYPGEYPYPPGQSYPGEAYPPGQPYPPSQYPGQPYPGQPHPGQPYPPGGQYPGQPYLPGQPYPLAPGEVTPVAGTQWRIHSVNNRDTPPGDFYIRFDPDRFEAKLNCNGLGAGYVQHGTTLQPGALIGTRMACPDMSWERDGSAVLSHDMQLYWAGPDRLTLTNRYGSILLRR